MPGIRRRASITLLGGSAASPYRALAQQSTVRGSIDTNLQYIGAFRRGLAVANYVIRPIPPLLTALILIAVSALAGCSRAVPGEEGEKAVETEVAVEVGRVMKADLRVTVEAYGMAEPEPAKTGSPGGGAKLAAPFPGIVVAIHGTEGQSVKAGDVVVEFDDRIAQAAVEKARHALEYAEQVADRFNKLVTSRAISVQLKQEADQRVATARADLASAQAAVAQVRLASPLDGILARINVQLGQSVDFSTVVAEIVDLKRLVVTVNVPADEAAQLKDGQTADIFAAIAKTPATTGRVSFISPLVDQKTGSVPVRLELPENSGLRSGQFIRARIVTQLLMGRLVVPRNSVVKADDEEVIYVVEDDKAAQTPVKTGVRDGDMVEVDGDGLKEGTTIVTVGAYGLPEETKVKITNKSN